MQPAKSKITAARLLDVGLEASIIGSFSRVGIALRSRVEKWPRPPRMDGQVAIVTGATSGLGLRTAIDLAILGASVIAVGRSSERANAAVAAIAAESGSSTVGCMLADLGDLDQTRRLAEEVGRRCARLDVVVHNAGALLTRYQRSPQGVETTVTTQVLSPFLLTDRLSGLLGESPSARVVTVTSGGMYSQRFDLSSLEMPEGSYDGVTAYSRAKRAQVVLNAHWARRAPRPSKNRTEVRYHCVHPGWADTPGIKASLPRFSTAMGPLLRTAEEGADTIVWLAAGAPGSEPNGRLWLDRRPRGEYYLPWTRPSPAQRALEGPALWEWCSARTTEHGTRTP